MLKPGILVESPSPGSCKLQGNSFRCIDQIRGCNCPSCQMKTDLSMQDMMYCVRGSEFENRYINNIK